MRRARAVADFELSVPAKPKGRLGGPTRTDQKSAAMMIRATDRHLWICTETGTDSERQQNNNNNKKTMWRNAGLGNACAERARSCLKDWLAGWWCRRRRRASPSPFFNWPAAVLLLLLLIVILLLVVVNGSCYNENYSYFGLVCFGSIGWVEFPKML